MLNFFSCISTNISDLYIVLQTMVTWPYKSRDMKVRNDSKLEKNSKESDSKRNMNEVHDDVWVNNVVMQKSSQSKFYTITYRHAQSI